MEEAQQRRLKIARFSLKETHTFFFKLFCGPVLGLASTSISLSKLDLYAMTPSLWL